MSARAMTPHVNRISSAESMSIYEQPFRDAEDFGRRISSLAIVSWVRGANTFWHGPRSLGTFFLTTMDGAITRTKYPTFSLARARGILEVGVRRGSKTTRTQLETQRLAVPREAETCQRDSHHQPAGTPRGHWFRVKAALRY